jgi:hypothetical protein
MRWYPIVATYSDEGSKTIVKALREKGYEADYQTSKIEKIVFVRDEKEVVEKLLETLSGIRRKYPELFAVVVEERKLPYLTVTNYTRFVDLIPDRDELYYSIHGIEVSRPPRETTAAFFEDLLSRISVLEMRVRQLRMEELMGELISLRREITRMREEIDKLKEEELRKFKEEVLRKLEEMENKLT